MIFCGLYSSRTKGTDDNRKFSLDFIKALSNAAGNMAVSYLSALPDPHIQHTQLTKVAISYSCQLLIIQEIFF